MLTVHVSNCLEISYTSCKQDTFKKKYIYFKQYTTKPEQTLNGNILLDIAVLHISKETIQLPNITNKCKQTSTYAEMAILS